MAARLSANPLTRVLAALMGLLALTGLLLLSGCTADRQEAESQQAVLTAYYQPLLAQAADPAQYELRLLGGEEWYLIRWEATGAAQLANPFGEALPLQYELVEEPVDGVALDITVTASDAGALGYAITNQGTQTVSLRQLWSLDVELDGNWYRLAFNGVTNQSVTRDNVLAPGESRSDQCTPRLGAVPLTLPAGHYRWCFAFRTDAGQSFYRAVTFDLPEA